MGINPFWDNFSFRWEIDIASSILEISLPSCDTALYLKNGITTPLLLE
jgi:hypothetical protein